MFNIEQNLFYRIIRKIYRKKKWQTTNKHNKIILKNIHNYKNVIVKNYSYGLVDAIFTTGKNEKLYIGNFVSIANGVKFIVASEHPYKNISTFPFKVNFMNYDFESTSKGNIVVKDDVWIGENALILSGITIGQGAIVGAGSIVTKDIPPYAIVGGNPAKIIKYRFSPNIIEKLLKIDYSKLTPDNIKTNCDVLYSNITEKNIDEVISCLKI